MAPVSSGESTVRPVVEGRAGRPPLRGLEADAEGGSRRSTTRTGGSEPPVARSGSRSSSNLPPIWFDQLSSDGVALPSRHSAPSWRARMMATSRA